MSLKGLINREIRERRDRIRGRVVSAPRQVNFDTTGAQFFTWVVDVDVGGDEILRNVPVKINGPKARFYARVGFPVFLEKDAQGRYQVVSPADRAPQQGGVILVDESTGQASAGGNFGFQVIRRPYEFYKGTVPESFFDPGADANTLAWIRSYDRDRQAGTPLNVDPATDADGADVTGFTDKSGNGFDVVPAGTPAPPVYRKFDSTNNQVNDLSTVEWEGADRMDFASNIVESTAGEISIFALVNKDVIGAGFDAIVQTRNFILYSRITAGDTWGVFTGTTTTSSTGTVGANFTLIELVANGFNDLSFYQDGTLLTTATPAGSGVAGSTSVLGNSTFTEPFDGRLVELLIMDEVVSSTKRQAIEAYFNQAMFVQYALYGDGVTPYPKISVIDAQGNEV